jgi:6-hydroxycyclohex-1-ene-1-carbonyl-CoA dehydrogenase
MVKPNRPLERVEAPLAEPGPGEVLLKISGCGACHPDLGFCYDGVPIKSALRLAQ